MSLSPDEAAEIAGVPAEQLRRWAWDRVGPKNVGTRYNPKYTFEDITEWRMTKGSEPTAPLQPCVI